MIHKAFSPFKRFVLVFQNSSYLLLACVVVSLLLANSAWQMGWASSINTPVFAHFTVQHIVNDGFMSVFFLLVGLEIKRELQTGELAEKKRAILPIIAALGGMLVPAGLYYFCNTGSNTVQGWGIPMATDIAFSLAILSLLGTRIPVSIKVFLTALAIVDDLGAVLVIAVFYGSAIHWWWLGLAAVIVLLLIVCNYANVTKLWLYLALGLVLWYAMLHSGVHATLSGILLAFCIPNSVKNALLEPLEHALDVPVNYVIMPLFALVNTAIPLNYFGVDNAGLAVSMGIVLGLCLGKPLGIALFSFVACKIKIADWPLKANAWQVLGVGMLAGIGFTMSIFVAMLSFADANLVNAAKTAVLIASALSACMGYVCLRFLGANKSVAQGVNNS